MKLKLAAIPQEVISEYKLRSKVTADGHMYIEINKEIYGLSQAELLAQEPHFERLAEHGYSQCNISPGVWRHETKPIMSTLVVNGFGVKYVNTQDASQLISVLKQHYSVTENWKGEQYIVMYLHWEYKEDRVHVAMPGYVARALSDFQHKAPRKRQDTPYGVAPRKYGAALQYVDEPVASLPVGKADQKFIQKVTGQCLYIGCSVDNILLTMLSTIASKRASPTEDTMEHTRNVLPPIDSQDDAVITYQGSNMVLTVHSDTGYRNVEPASIRTGGHFFLVSNIDIPHRNGVILNVVQIINAMMSPATEAELGTLYINAREVVHIYNILQNMGYT